MLIDKSYISELANRELWLFPTMLGIILIALAQYNYVTFHTIAELFAIIISFSMFAFAWATDDYSKNKFLVYLACGYFAIGLLDLSHTLTFKGVNVFVEGNTNLTSQFWISARYFEAFLLLSAPSLIDRTVNRRTFLMLFIAVSITIFAMITSGYFPDTFIDGQGLTAFKIGSEYLIILILIGAIYRISQLKEKIEKTEKTLIICAVILTIAAELMFTFYVDMFDRSHQAGHIFKIFSYWMIFQAVVLNNLRKPYQELRKVNVAIDQSPASVQIMDVKGLVQFANDKFSEMTGYSTEEVLGRPSSLFMSLGQTDASPQDVLTNMHSDDNARFELLRERKDGSQYWESALISPIRSHTGETVNYLAITEDITDRKQSEKLRTRANQVLKAMSECSAALVKSQTEEDLLCEICRVVVETGDYALAWVGYLEDDEDKSIRPVALYGADDGYVDSVRATWGDTERGLGPVGMAARTGNPSVFQGGFPDSRFSLWREAAIERGFLATGSIPLLDQGQSFGVLSFYAKDPNAFDKDEVHLLSDLASNLAYGILALRQTEKRKQVEAELVRHRDLLEEKVLERTAEVHQKAEELEKALESEKRYSALQQQFVSLVSHELRTPLSIIDGTTQRIIRLKNKITPDQLVERGSKIRFAVERMVGLIDSTLYASRLDAGKIEMNIQPCKIRELLAETCDRQKEISPRHDFCVDLDGIPEYIDADPRLLEHIFTNLLSNAVKYAPDTPLIEVTGEIDVGMASISIRDQGLGIPENDLPHMFERYFRAKTAEGIKGTGIGLSVSKEFVEMHDGDIKVDSVEGEGASFTVRLPIGGRDQ